MLSKKRVVEPLRGRARCFSRDTFPVLAPPHLTISRHRFPNQIEHMCRFLWQGSFGSPYAQLHGERVGWRDPIGENGQKAMQLQFDGRLTEGLPHLVLAVYHCQSQPRG